ncbi:8333_t:CDS:2, partial [Diversispora eburnea]
MSKTINRFWCKVTIPIIWELVLDQEFNWDNLRNKAFCIRTCVSCMDTQARTLLTRNGFDLSSSPSQATFDYPSFTHKFIINNFINFISIYSQQIIVENFCHYSDLMGSILELPGAPKVFKNLKNFTSMIGNDYQIFPLYESLKLICDNILDMDLFLYSYSQLQLFSKLISVQKRLENLLIDAFDYPYNRDSCDSIFWAIISQKETLKRLCLKKVYFYDFEEKSSSSIGQFTSLQELYIEDCDGLYNYLSSSSSFTQL